MMIEVLSKKIGKCGSIEIHVTIVENQPEPFVVFAGENEKVLLALNRKALRELSRLLRLAEAAISGTMKEGERG